MFTLQCLYVQVLSWEEKWLFQVTANLCFDDDGDDDNFNNNNTHDNRKCYRELRSRWCQGTLLGGIE